MKCYPVKTTIHAPLTTLAISLTIGSWGLGQSTKVLAQVDEPPTATSTELSGVPADAQKLPRGSNANLQLFRHDNQLFVVPSSEQAAGEVAIPRFFASLRSVHWQAADNSDLSQQPVSSTQSKSDPIQFKPELATWVLQWKTRPAGASTIVMQFDSPPLLAEENEPITASGDGSYWLPASAATATGSKLRFEPQTFKNTVGYWTQVDDFATWNAQIDAPGKFNVAILQGCGRGQGGSTAAIEFTFPEVAEMTRVEFQVEETGHFQNFQWRHLGEIDIAQTGMLSVTCRAVEIRKAALMDVRAIHLIRKP